MGCTFVPDSLEVIVYPEVDANISGDTIICDDGCTTLYGISSAGYSYMWTDQSAAILTPNSPPNTVTICFGSGITSVNLEVTDANNCTASSSVMIEYYTSPDVTITPSDPTLCADTPNTLTASTTFPNPVDYSWSTGDIGDNITVGLEGTYYVTVTDPASGCTDIAFIIINPLPNLCLVPTGCYTACDPDTLCAPSGLTAYEWYYNGVIRPMYSGMECIQVTESGAYNFEGTNSFGCTDVSDTLFLEMVPCCREGDTEISAIVEVMAGPCCYKFSYEVNQDIFYSFDLHSDDAGLDIDVSSVDPLLVVTSSIPSLNSFESTISGNPMPLGPLTDFITICLDDVTTDPALILIDWRGEDGSILCTDSLELECAVEPDCIYAINDSIFCGPNGNLLYDVTICNPASADYSISYIDFIEISPIGATFVPSEIDLTGSPLLPGECRMYQLSVLGSGLANDTMKFKLVGHENNPLEDPGTLCCSADSLYCVFIPGCTICDMTYVSSVDTSDLGDCCFDITVHNYFEDSAFDGIDLCVLTSGATFDIVNRFGSPWDIATLSDTRASIDYNDGPATNIPIGFTELPTICIEESDSPLIEIEIKWMDGQTVVCRDTITLVCPGDCGYMSDYSIICNENGTWLLTGYITNTSDHVISSAFIDFGYNLIDDFNTSIDLGALAPMETYGPFAIILDIPPTTTQHPDELCIITTLHSLSHSEAHGRLLSV